MSTINSPKFLKKELPSAIAETSDLPMVDDLELWDKLYNGIQEKS